MSAVEAGIASSTPHGTDLDRVQVSGRHPVMAFGQFTRVDADAAPGMVSVHRAALARAPDDRQYREQAVGGGVQQVPGIGVGLA